MGTIKYQNSWLTNGNSNINPATNFLGTLDNNDLVLKEII